MTLERHKRAILQDGRGGGRGGGTPFELMKRRDVTSPCILNRTYSAVTRSHNLIVRPGRHHPRRDLYKPLPT